jgi:hypothetical protein
LHGVRAVAQPPVELQPFFDDVAQIGDITPPPPQLSAFDRAVLAVCGDFGSRPSKNDFRAMLDDPAHRMPVADIYTRLDREILGQKLRLSAFKDELTAVWFAAEGFRHIFCGEPRLDDLGGMHFAGRYLQMQEEGWGGLMEDCRPEIEPPVYTVGVLYRTPDGLFAESCPKGYALDLDAADLIVEATTALKALRRYESGDGVCLKRVRDGGDYLAVFATADGAIRTFYSDASPRCGDGRPTNACLCGE